MSDEFQILPKDSLKKLSKEDEEKIVEDFEKESKKIREITKSSFNSFYIFYIFMFILFIITIIGMAYYRLLLAILIVPAPFIVILYGGRILILGEGMIQSTQNPWTDSNSTFLKGGGARFYGLLLLILGIIFYFFIFLIPLMISKVGISISSINDIINLKGPFLASIFFIFCSVLWIYFIYFSYQIIRNKYYFK